MPDHDFVFALDLSDEEHFDLLLQDVAVAVLRHVGYDAAAIEQVTGAVRTALRGTADTSRRCTVRFHAYGGHLQIGVAYTGGDSWETTRPLPAR